MARYVFMGIGVVMILVGILLGAVRQYWLIPGYKKLTQQQREEHNQKQCEENGLFPWSDGCCNDCSRFFRIEQYK